MPHYRRRQKPAAKHRVVSATVGYPIKCPYIISVDTREQAPFTFESITDFATGARVLITTERATVPSGDYSIRFHSAPIVVDWHDRVAVERKSMSDLFNSYLGDDREREERKLARLNELQFAAMVVEGTTADLLSYRCRHMPAASDQGKRAEMLRNAVFKLTQSFPRVHWFFEPTIERAEEATWRVLDWFYKNSLARTQQ